MSKAGRLYFPLDVSFFDGDGAELSDSAQLLFLRILARLKIRNSDAWVSPAQVKLWGRSLDGTVADAINELAETPLVQARDGRFFVPAWQGWQRSTASEGPSSGEANHVRWHLSRDEYNENCQWCRSSAELSTDNPGSDPGISDPDSSSKQASKQADKGSDPDPLEDDFGCCWEIWPKQRDARKPALIAYRARRREGISAEDLLTAAKNYVIAVRAEKRENSKIMDCKTFFGPNERWMPYLDPVIVELPTERRELSPNELNKQLYKARRQQMENMNAEMGSDA